MDKTQKEIDKLNIALTTLAVKYKDVKTQAINEFKEKIKQKIRFHLGLYETDGFIVERRLDEIFNDKTAQEIIGK